MSNHNISHLRPKYTKFDGHYDLNKKNESKNKAKEIVSGQMKM